MDALEDLLRTFADDAPYPAGAIRFEITPFTMGYSGLRRETLVCPTDGGTRFAAALRALSVVAMGVGVVASLALQGEVAVPAFFISGLLAGAGGAFSLYDRLEHGDFAWDMQTGLDILDIAAAVLTVGVSSAGTATVRGVGRLSFGARVQPGGRDRPDRRDGRSACGEDRGSRPVGRPGPSGAGFALRPRGRRARPHCARIGAPSGRASERTSPTPETPPTTRTSSGTSRGPAAPPSTAPPGTPEFHQQVHDQWVASLRKSGLAERRSLPRGRAAAPKRRRPDRGRGAPRVRRPAGS